MEELILLRHDLHKHPEVSGNEINTAKTIIDFLENYPPKTLKTHIGGNGIIAIYEGEKSGKSVLIRCELDALPIQEINTFDYQSIYKDVSHKCGHDGHMTILCGLAKELYENKLHSGTILLLFQPAEENGKGAKAVLENLYFDSINLDYVFALHNLPGYAKHQIICKENTFTCAVNSMIIELHGKTSHAGEPENGINPALAVAEIITFFNSKINTNLSSSEYCLITPIYINMGEKAYGVSAGFGEIHFTIRSNSNAQMKLIESKLEEEVLQITENHDLGCKISWTESFQANENDEKAINFIREAATTLNLDILEKELPFTFGEDFGLFTQKFKGAMFGLGSGENTPALHNPDYDFPDEIIETGIKMFHQITKEILNA